MDDQIQELICKSSVLSYLTRTAISVLSAGAAPLKWASMLACSSCLCSLSLKSAGQLLQPALSLPLTGLGRQSNSS